MKKFTGILFAILVSFMFVGCKEKVEIDHPIAGHTYSVYFDTDSGYSIFWIEFHSNGDFMERWFEHNRYLGDKRGQLGHMLWSVEGNEITVRNDNSSVFLPEYKGIVMYEGFFYPTDSTVTLNGVVYEFQE